MGRDAARVGDDRRSQAARHSLHPLGAALSRHRRNRSRHHPHPVDVPAQRLRVAAGVQPDVHDARHDDDLLLRHADPVRVRQLPGAADDRRARHGVSAPECLQLLAERARRVPAVFQLSRRKRLVRRGQRAGCGMVGVRAVDRASVFAGLERRLLDDCRPGLRFRQHRHGRQPDRHDPLHAMPRHDPRPHAAAGLALPDHVRTGADRDHAALGRAADAARRPLSRRPLLRHAGRRIRHALDALLLDLRTPGSLHPRDSGVCVHVGDHSGLLSQTDLRLSGHGGGDGVHRLRQHERVGAPHVHDRHELVRQQLFRDHHDGRRRSDGNQDLQLARDDVGRPDPVQDADAVLDRVPVPVPDCRADGDHAGRGPVRLAAEPLVLRGRAFSLRDRRRHSVRALRRLLLLVSESHRTTDERAARQSCISGCS